MSQNGPFSETDKRKKWVAFVQAFDPSIDPASVRLMDELRQVSHMLRLVGENSLADTGLSWAKFRLLMGLLMNELLDGRDEMNPSEISSKQGTSRNTISALIRDLEADGLIKRTLDPEDRRKFNIRLTEAGRAKVYVHANSHLQAVAGCFSALSGEEQTTLGQLLGKLSSAVCEQARSGHHRTV